MLPAGTCCTFFADGLGPMVKSRTPKKEPRETAKGTSYRLAFFAFRPPCPHKPERHCNLPEGLNPAGLAFALALAPFGPAGPLLGWLAPVDADAAPLGGAVCAAAPPCVGCGWAVLRGAGTARG